MKKIDFKEIPISSDYGIIIRKVFYVVVDGRSKMMEAFSCLDENMKDDIKVFDFKNGNSRTL